jgi:hypothetical protein
VTETFCATFQPPFPCNQYILTATI